MKLSFGMIFSIILIIIFLVFAFYVIGKFLDMKGSVEAGKFIGSLQTDVDKMWKSSQGSYSNPDGYFLPTKVEAVCFADYLSDKRGKDSDKYRTLKQSYDNEQNIFFYPVGSGQGLDSAKIEHLNIEKITENRNPFCIESSKGKISLTITKNFDDSLVVVAE